MSQKKVYGLSEALKIILLPDGNISDLDDDDYQSDDETKNLNPISVFDDDEIAMPKWDLWNVNFNKLRLL